MGNDRSHADDEQKMKSSPRVAVPDALSTRRGSAGQLIDASGVERVSVIIPAYNVAPYIAQTLNSVFAQTKSAFEVIVVNDGSPDTAELEHALQPFRDRIVYLKQENRGLSGARNTGIRAATGDLIALLDGDDLWMPGYLETQTRFLRSHPEYDLVYCNALFFGDSIRGGKQFMAVCPSRGEVTPAAIISRKCCVFVSVTARAEALRELGFDESLRSCEDFDCWLRLTSSGRRIGYHREILVQYRKRDASLSADPTWMAEWHLKVLKKARAHWPKESNEGSLLETAIAQKTAELAFLRGKEQLRTGDVNSAVVEFTEANRYHRGAKMAALILLLRLAPGLIRRLFRLRDMLLPTHKASTTQ
jgi:glycosyltransferase involved in cell wall biosynthesis